MEVDPALAEQAARNLKAAGYQPDLIVGDSATAVSIGLFDRMHVTFAIREVPCHWVRRVRPAGRIVAPYQPWWGLGHILQLDVGRDEEAYGKFHPGVGYMRMRGQRPAVGSPQLWTAANEEGHTVTFTQTTPRAIVDCPAGADLFIAHRVPSAHGLLRGDTFWVLDGHGPGGSWARVEPASDPRGFLVEQAGPQKLWDEVEVAYFEWLSLGSPAAGDFTLTLSPEGQTLARV